MDTLIQKKDLVLKRGDIIPKYEESASNRYPVYSSSIQNKGLMGYYSTYMFNEELITWSIDGGGDFFYREKHKYNVTNVSGYIKLNERFSYGFVSEALKYQHSKKIFDYQNKAHPSVISKVYQLPIINIEIQKVIWVNIKRINDLITGLEYMLKKYSKLKQFLLQNLFK